MANLNSAIRLKKLYELKATLERAEKDAQGIVKLPTSDYDKVEETNDILELVIDPAKKAFTDGPPHGDRLLPEHHGVHHPAAGSTLLCVFARQCHGMGWRCAGGRCCGAVGSTSSPL